MPALELLQPHISRSAAVLASCRCVSTALGLHGKSSMKVGRCVRDLPEARNQNSGLDTNTKGLKALILDGRSEPVGRPVENPKAICLCRFP